MEYNTSKEHLKMAQYGRAVQQMAQHLLTMEDKAARLKNAEVLVTAMIAVHPEPRQTEDFRHEVWDHLHILTDYKLDVESPYPLPDKEAVTKRPTRIPYPASKNKIMHLGRNIEAMIRKARKDPDPEKKKGYTQMIGHYMKLAYGNWHHDIVTDETVKHELDKLSEGELQYEPSNFKIHYEPISKKGQGGSSKYKKNKN